MGYFMTERLDKEFKLLESHQYRLYGNKEGVYPVTTDILGGFDNGLLSAENEKGITHFIINSHGAHDSIDQCIYTDPQDLLKYSNYRDRLRDYFQKNNLWELRISFLNFSNVSMRDTPDPKASSTLKSCMQPQSWGAQAIARMITPNSTCTMSYHSITWDY